MVSEIKLFTIYKSLIDLEFRLTMLVYQCLSKSLPWLVVVHPLTG